MKSDFCWMRIFCTLYSAYRIVLVRIRDRVPGILCKPSVLSSVVSCARFVPPLPALMQIGYPPAHLNIFVLLYCNKLRSLTLLERTCCDGGIFNASSDTWSCNVGDSSDEPVLSIFAVAGLAAAGFVVLVVCLGACCSRWKRRNKANQSSYNFPVSAIPTS